jgi:chromosome segregation ATPase
VRKLQIIIIVALAFISFAGTFGVSFFLKKRAAVIPEVDEESSQQTAEASGEDDEDYVPQAIFLSGGDDSLSMSMTEKQLQGLIFDIREKIREHEKREEDIREDEKRVQLAKEALEEEIDQLDDLRAELTTTLAKLREQEKELKRSVIEVEEVEKKNLQIIAARYDRMDIDHAAKIIINMVENKQTEDAVKILFYMQERTSGELLGEIGDINADIASLLSNKLKRVKEGE